MKKYVPALLRLAMGWTFFWPFLDKLFGLGHATAPESAWLAGNSPTSGFLSHTEGIFSPIFQAMSGNIVVDWLFMLGLLLIGLALILGIGMRIATYSGVALLALMFLASIPLDHNPILDEHIIYLLVLLVLPMLKAEETWGLGKWWKKLPFVKSHKWLQ